jgi:photosystem II stability/assembly factor-like uncharacterized protein
MAIILSISEANETRWAAGPHGLFKVDSGQLAPLPQPMERLASVLALQSRLLVGGAPHGVAYTADQGQNWQAAWMSGCQTPVLVIAADPDVANSGVLLAGTEGEGILRSTDRGGYWFPCNYGLRNYMILSMTWAPSAPPKQWPRREVVFATTEEGIYRSPNAGRAWKRADCPDTVYQIVAVSPQYHHDGLVLAGAEEDGLWRSSDGGRSFARVASAPAQVNALCAWEGGWLLSGIDQLWSSVDGEEWQPVEGSEPALVLRKAAGGILVGSENGVALLHPDNLKLIAQFASPELV